MVASAVDNITLASVLKKLAAESKPKPGEWWRSS
jgi:hypothetical protein